ncbi:MAG: hypothetical protein ACP5JH_11970, partial [Bacteroidota bacterium]
VFIIRVIFRKVHSETIIRWAGNDAVNGLIGQRFKYLQSVATIDFIYLYHFDLNDFSSSLSINLVH